MHLLRSLLAGSGRLRWPSSVPRQCHRRRELRPLARYYNCGRGGVARCRRLAFIGSGAVTAGRRAGMWPLRWVSCGGGGSVPDSLTVSPAAAAVSQLRARRTAGPAESADSALSLPESPQVPQVPRSLRRPPDDGGRSMLVTFCRGARPYQNSRYTPTNVPIRRRRSHYNRVMCIDGQRGDTGRPAASGRRAAQSHR